MGQALYRKYRPKKLSEVIGEEHITSTLSNELANSELSHAYLFTGPRGVGKTSVARILAHEINGFTYNDDDTSYLDIIEIDAASNRRIDEIRELRDKVNLAPTSGKYKIYIIDEVHMLTREAFNALLKTLEEPPSHVIFILATTEAYKVPETIVSRTQLFSFRPIAYSQIIKHLKDIANREKITINDKAIEIIAEFGQGSFRDSIGLLDQVSSTSKNITEKDLESLLGIAPEKIVEDIFKAIHERSLRDLADIMVKIDEDGYNLTLICSQLISKIKHDLLDGSDYSLEPHELLQLMKNIVDVPDNSDPLTRLEIVLFDVVIDKHPLPDQQPEQKSIPKNSTPSIKMQDEKLINKPEPKVLTNKKEPKKIVEQPEKDPNVKHEEFNAEVWPEVLNAIKKKYNTLYGIVRMAVPEFGDDSIKLTTKFEFHQRLLNDVKNQTIIIDIVRELTGRDIEIKCGVDKDLDLNPSSNEAEKISDEIGEITTINNIFGSTEVLE